MHKIKRNYVARKSYAHGPFWFFNSFSHSSLQHKYFKTSEKIKKIRNEMLIDILSEERYFILLFLSESPRWNSWRMYLFFGVLKLLSYLFYFLGRRNEKQLLKFLKKFFLSRRKEIMEVLTERRWIVLLLKFEVWQEDCNVANWNTCRAIGLRILGGDKLPFRFSLNSP